MSIRRALEPCLSSYDLAIPSRGKDGFESNSRVVELSGIELRKHSTAEKIKLAIGEETWNDYFKFTFVRHPTHRLVSLYEFLERIRRKHEPALHDGKKFFSTSRSKPKLVYPDQPPWNWLGMQALLTTEDFSQFIRSEYLHRAQDARPQRQSLADRQGKLLVDFVGKVENLADDWNRIRTRLGCQSSLSRENKSQH